MARKAEELRSPVHDDRLELCACRAAGPLSGYLRLLLSRRRRIGAHVEAGVRRAVRVQIAEHALEGACCREVGIEVGVLPVREACGHNAVTHRGPSDVEAWEDLPGTMSFW